MTTLIVKAFNSREPGSYKFRKRVLQAIVALRKAQDDPYETAKLTLEVSEMIESKMTTDDGTPVEDALDTLTADDFDLMLQGMLRQGNESTIPNPSTPS